MRVGHGKQHFVTARPPLDAVDRLLRAQFRHAAHRTLVLRSGKDDQFDIGLVQESVAVAGAHQERDAARSEEHTSELQSLMRISYAVFCLKKKIDTDQEINRLINK